MSSGSHKENYKSLHSNYLLMLKNLIKIRLAKTKDAKARLQVHYDAVHEIASKDYGRRILNDWSPLVTDERIREYNKRPREGKITLVAEIKGEIIGLGTIVPKEREIRAIYISPKSKRKGVGTALLRRLEKIAKEKGIKELNLESSITAEKFYNKNGYKSLRYRYFTLHTGRKMRSIKMFKTL